MIKWLFKKKLPETFCVAPFIQMDLHEQGHVNACCKAKDVLGDWSQSKISRIWNDTPIQKLRTQFLNGDKPKGCKSCWDMEEKNLRSRRIEYNTKLSEKVTAIENEWKNNNKNITQRAFEFSNIDIGFGAQCNLKCRMCGPSASSSWLATSLKNKDVYKYYAELGELDPSVQEVNHKDFLSEELFEDFCKHIAPNVEDLMISGGEPLLSKHHFRLFSEMVPEAQLNKMKVSLTTNAQTTEYKGQSLVPYWKKLNYFIYRVSFDNVGPRYSYIRTDGDIAHVVQSINDVQASFGVEDGQLKTVITTAISLYNIENIPQLIEFCIEQGAFFHINWVQFPWFLSVDQLPAQRANEILIKLENYQSQLKELKQWEKHLIWTQPIHFDREFYKYKNILQEHQLDPNQATYKDWALILLKDNIDEIVTALKNSDRPTKLPSEFRNHTVLFDRINNTNFAETYPELSSYL